MTTSDLTVRNSLKISTVKQDGSQDITIYDYRSKGKRDFNAPKDNVDKFIHVLAGVKTKSGQTIGTSSLIGAVGFGILGFLAKKGKGLKGTLGLLVGAIGGLLVGFIISAMTGPRKILQAQETFLEKRK